MNMNSWEALGPRPTTTKASPFELAGFGIGIALATGTMYAVWCLFAYPILG